MLNPWADSCLARAALALLAGAALVTVPARAQQVGSPRTEAVRLEYRAPGGCPDERAFFELVRSRTESARFARPDEIARTLHVSVEVGVAQTIARMRYVDAQGNEITREVPGESCKEVVEGMALVAALAIEARVAPRTSAATGSTPPPRPRAERASKTRKPAQEGARPAPERLEATVSSRWDIGLELQGGTGPSPEPLLGLGAFADLRPQGAEWTARLTLELSSSEAEAQGGQVEFQRLAARIDACPLLIEPSRSLALLACGGLEGGRLRGQGVKSRRIAEPEEAAILWAAALLLARAQLDIQELLVLEARGEFSAPLVRHRFVLERPRFEVHEIPWLGWGLALGIAFRLQ
jgi:hypothetical protein